MDEEINDYMIGGGGENNRVETAEAERRDHEVTSIQYLITLYFCFAGTIVLFQFAWWIILAQATFTYIFNNDLIFTFPRVYTQCLKFGTLFPPLAEIIVYSAYFMIETEAFDEFENTFPTFEDGQGDSKRLELFTWTKFWKILLIKSKYIKEIVQENIISILLFICEVILMYDIGYQINELHFIYYQLPFAYKFLITGPIVLLAYLNDYIPLYLSYYLMLDTFIGVYHPVVYKVPGPIITFSLILWIPRIIYICYLYKKSSPVVQQMPNLERVFAVITSRIGEDVHGQLFATMLLFARWLEITGQSQRHNIMGVHLLEPIGID